MIFISTKSHRHWCDQQLWPQELLKLLEVLEQNNNGAKISAPKKLEGALECFQRCSPDPASVKAALELGSCCI